MAKNHQEGNSLLYISLWVLSVTEVSAFLLGQQNDQSQKIDLQALPKTPIKDVWYNSLNFQDSISLVPDYRNSFDKNVVSPPYFQSTDLEERKNDYFNRLQNFAEVISSDKTYELPNDVDKTFETRSKRKRAKNVQVFHLLGIYLRSVNQAKRRRLQKQREQEEAKAAVRPVSSNQNRQPSDMLQAMAYIDGTIGLAQQDPAEGNERSEDNKRTIFVSQGWAPSGGIERDLQNQELKDKEKAKANAKMFAFTSNHWGPLGKRGQPTIMMGLGRPQMHRFKSPKF